MLKKQVGKDSRAMTNDIIADALTRIRNASMRKHDSTTLIFAKIVESILKIFQEKGYIEVITSLKMEVRRV